VERSVTHYCSRQLDSEIAEPPDVGQISGAPGANHANMQGSIALAYCGEGQLNNTPLQADFRI
jgi:hypothetical protein